MSSVTTKALEEEFNSAPLRAPPTPKGDVFWDYDRKIKTVYTVSNVVRISRTDLIADAESAKRRALETLALEIARELLKKELIDFETAKNTRRLDIEIIGTIRVIK